MVSASDTNPNTLLRENLVGHLRLDLLLCDLCRIPDVGRPYMKVPCRVKHIMVLQGETLLKIYKL